MNITVSVHGRWHAFELASVLNQKGKLVKLITTYPKFGVRRIIGEKIPIASKPILEIRRRIYDRWKLGGKPDLKIAESFGRFAANMIPEELDIFVGWSSASLEAIPVVQSCGGKVVVERGSTHIQHQTEILSLAYENFGLTFDETQAGIICREVQEYERADAIAVPTNFAASTFTDRGIPKEKIIVNPYGVNLSLFSPPWSNSFKKPLKIVCVGSVGIRKGAPWLIEAIRTMGTDVECHFIGAIEEKFREKFIQNLPDNVVFRGPLSIEVLINEYRQADLFCLPSLEEGFPLSLLQAMASGLPSVVTESVSGNLVKEHINGLIVPAMNAEALAACLMQLAAETDLRIEMGKNARQAVEAGYTWSEYGDRAIAAYENLLDVA